MRRLILVAGSGRSGTSLMTSTLRELGFHVPQPEVVADETNPKGFGEPRWVVDFHSRLLKDAGKVRIADADPHARERVVALNQDPEIRAELQQWLDGEFGVGERVLIKDPRLLWFLPLWEAAGVAAGATVGVVTMLRHPAEVVRSKLVWYSHIPDTEASALAGWVNSSLEAEASTLHLTRKHLLFTDLQQDWRSQVAVLAETFGMPELSDAVETGGAAVDALYDSHLHRSKAEWDDIDVPAELLSIAETLWDELVRVDSGGAESQQVLAECRERYAAFYAQAESITHSNTAFHLRPLKRSVRQLTHQNEALKENLAARRAELKEARRALREANKDAGSGHGVGASLKSAARRLKHRK
ncbi:MAG: hypothetical protein FWE71_16150 [Nocardioidaceae bacterium]|nr:hypothetical protein [Nocardioidaceae bacterium]MCL2613101.1 hypothetical protein [Nocardioidaceae bacterium]